MTDYDEEFDTQFDVEQNPCGAWQAIQELTAERDRYKARAERAEEACDEIVQMLWKRMAEGEQCITSTEVAVYQKLRGTLAQIDAEPAEPRQPTVKPLEWEGYGHWHSGDNEGWMEEANTAFGWGYSIEFGYDGNFMLDNTFGCSQDGFDTPDEAKAAAQADYERRILSALITEDQSDG